MGIVKSTKLIAEETGMGANSIREIAKASGAARWVGRRLFVDEAQFFDYLNRTHTTKGSQTAAVNE